MNESNAKDKYNDEQSQSVVFQFIVIAGTRLLILADQRLRVEVVVFEVPAPPVRGEGPNSAQLGHKNPLHHHSGHRDLRGLLWQRYTCHHRIRLI